MAGRSFPFAVVDAFTSKPFSGNPAAVMILPKDHGLSDEQFQQIAAEFNHSETAFVVPLDDHGPSSPHFSLRWFTPATEVELCGHATIASTSVLFTSPPFFLDPLTSPKIHFSTRFKGSLYASRSSSSPGSFELDFPEEPVTQVEPQEAADLGVEKGFKGGVLEGRVKNVASGGFWTLVEVDPDVDVEAIEPDHTQLAKLFPSHALILTASVLSSSAYAKEGISILSRVFAHNAGIPEDPVTGSAHCVLGPYWLSKQGNGGGGGTVKCKQVSKRGGIVEVEWRKAEKRVVLSGKAVKVMEGTIYL